jgi:serine/threonine protein kinase
MFGLGAKRHHLYLIDFGLSKRYWYHRRHVRMNTNLSLEGTPRFASINAHRGIEQSRRDDLEALGHTFLYLLRGSLPWSGLSGKGKEERLQQMKLVKESTSLSDLCCGYNSFERYQRYCRALGFMERPNYTMLRGLFSELRGSTSQQDDCQLQDHEFEWNAGNELGGLEPLAPAACLAQPEDEPPRAFRCFCYN